MTERKEIDETIISGIYIAIKAILDQHNLPVKDVLLAMNEKEAIKKKHVKCNKCGCWKQPEDFLNDKGRKLKSCITCRDRALRYRQKNREKLREGAKKYNKIRLAKEKAERAERRANKKK